MFLGIYSSITQIFCYQNKIHLRREQQTHCVMMQTSHTEIQADLSQLCSTYDFDHIAQNNMRTGAYKGHHTEYQEDVSLDQAACFYLACTHIFNWVATNQQQVHVVPTISILHVQTMKSPYCVNYNLIGCCT